MWNSHLSRDGLLIVISGPSGSGKTSVVKALYETDTALTVSVSATTRSPRPNEVDGVDYHFLSHSEFEDLVHRSGFLEWAKYGDNYYGTLKFTVESIITSGKDLILEIDVKGAMQVKALALKSVGIFILPPSFATLKKRLRSRNTESDADLQQRLRTAESEIPYVKDYDYCVVNPDNGVDEAVEQILHIISTERCRINNQLLKLISEEFSGESAD